MQNMLRIISITLVIALITAMITSQAYAAKWTALSQMAAANMPQQTLQSQAVGRHVLSTDTVIKAVKSQLESEQLAENLSVTLTAPKNRILYQYTKPITLKLHAVSIAPSNRAWQAQAYIISNNATIAVIPVSGRYEAIQRVPVLSHNLSRDDVITVADIDFIEMPARRMPNSTVLDAQSLIGFSPKNRISSKRPIRAHEITKPRLITKKGQVELIYSSNYITIRGVGQALEDGAQGDLIRIKNIDSGRAITARVIGQNKAEVNLTKAL
jgi:flagella basal body P-ring formation protein FlgA